MITRKQILIKRNKNNSKAFRYKIKNKLINKSMSRYEILIITASNKCRVYIFINAWQYLRKQINIKQVITIITKNVM